MDKFSVISKEKLVELKGKYIFHGSPILFDICKPHNAKCNSKNPLNEQNAIYGSDNLEFAILFAFAKLPKDKFHWCAVSDDIGFYAELHGETYIDDNAQGYIYCFDKNNFEQIKENDVQYVCYKELEPLCVHKIFYKDYKNLFKKVQNFKINNKSKK